MKVIIAENYDDMSKKGALLIAGQVVMGKKTVLGLATGSTPIGLYRELIAYYQGMGLDFSRIQTFNLDEYIGLKRDDPQSYYRFMHDNLFDHVNIKRENINFPNAGAKDLISECEEYERIIEKVGGIDLQLLGIGNNGHIGFNEPADSFNDGTLIVDLKAETIEANSRFFQSLEEVPKKAVSMGIGTIMKARKILLLANGNAKADAVLAMITGPICPKCPASALRLHNDVTVIIADFDKEYVDKIKKYASHFL